MYGNTVPVPRLDMTERRPARPVTAETAPPQFGIASRGPRVSAWGADRPAAGTGGASGARVARGGHVRRRCRGSQVGRPPGTRDRPVRRAGVATVPRPHRPPVPEVRRGTPRPLPRPPGPRQAPTPGRRRLPHVPGDVHAAGVEARPTLRPRRPAPGRGLPPPRGRRPTRRPRPQLARRPPADRRHPTPTFGPARRRCAGCGGWRARDRAGSAAGAGFAAAGGGFRV